MGKKAGFFLFLIAISLLRVDVALGALSEKTSSDKEVCSSVMSSELWQCYSENDKQSDYRIKKLKAFFAKYHSPLIQFSSVFIREADKNNLDWRLLPAISGVESTFGLAIPYQSFNAYGWDNGNYNFRDWTDSISQVTRALAIHYVAKGAKTVEQIAPIYNPVTPISWGRKVKYFMNAIDNTPPRILETLKFSIDI